MSHLSSEDLEALQKAEAIRRQIQQLQDDLDVLCEPVAKRMMAILFSDDLEGAKGLREKIDEFPDSFYRSEMRAAYMKKFPSIRISP